MISILTSFKPKKKQLCQCGFTSLGFISWKTRYFLRQLRQGGDFCNDTDAVHHIEWLVENAPGEGLKFKGTVPRT